MAFIGMTICTALREVASWALAANVYTVIDNKYSANTSALKDAIDKGTLVPLDARRALNETVCLPDEEFLWSSHRFGISDRVIKKAGVSIPIGIAFAATTLLSNLVIDRLAYVRDWSGTSVRIIKAGVGVVAAFGMTAMMCPANTEEFSSSCKEELPFTLLSAYAVQRLFFEMIGFCCKCTIE